MRTEDEVGWEGTTGRSCGGKMGMPETRRQKKAREWWGSVYSMVQIKNAVNYSFRQKFEP